MANIPSNRDYINDIEVSADAPVTEQLLNKIGADINALLDASWSSQTFLSNGNFTVPEGVSLLILVGSGGGGAGGHGGLGGTYGGAGGAGALISTRLVQVTPFDVHAVTIGGGGAAVNAPSSNNGGDTTFGTLATFKGGLGGAKGDLPGQIAAASSTALLSPTVASHFYTRLCYYGGVYATSGTDSDYASGGVTNSGGGGGASWDVGGAGGSNAPGAGATAAANSGAGGGGGGVNGLGGEAGGGNGGSGKLIVYWRAN